VGRAQGVRTHQPVWRPAAKRTAAAEAASSRHGTSLHEAWGLRPASPSLRVITTVSAVPWIGLGCDCGSTEGQFGPFRLKGSGFWVCKWDTAPRCLASRQFCFTGTSRLSLQRRRLDPRQRRGRGGLHIARVGGSLHRPTIRARRQAYKNAISLRQTHVTQVGLPKGNQTGGSACCCAPPPPVSALHALAGNLLHQHERRTRGLGADAVKSHALMTAFRDVGLQVPTLHFCKLPSRFKQTLKPINRFEFHIKHRVYV
jgi:hypothetical protein